MMHKHLTVFERLLVSLKGDNLVLAGTCALLAHGLKMSRTPNDLDVVIFTPSKSQLDVLKALSCVDDNEYPFEMTKQFKFIRNGMTINILIEDKFTPVDLLFTLFNGEYYKVQDIAYNMNAKCSFRTKKGEMRMKDVLDCADLKKSNFNY